MTIDLTSHHHHSAQQHVCQMVTQVKLIRCETLSESENIINQFLSANNDFAITEIQELRLNKGWGWMIVYRCKTE